MDFMLGDLADKLRPLGRLDLLAAIGRKALSYFGTNRPADLPLIPVSSRRVPCRRSRK